MAEATKVVPLVHAMAFRDLLSVAMRTRHHEHGRFRIYGTIDQPYLDATMLDKGCGKISKNLRAVCEQGAYRVINVFAHDTSPHIKYKAHQTVCDVLMFLRTLHRRRKRTLLVEIGRMQCTQNTRDVVHGYTLAFNKLTLNSRYVLPVSLMGYCCDENDRLDATYKRKGSELSASESTQLWRSFTSSLSSGMNENAGVRGFSVCTEEDSESYNVLDEMYESYDKITPKSEPVEYVQCVNTQTAKLANQAYWDLHARSKYTLKDLYHVDMLGLDDGVEKSGAFINDSGDDSSNSEGESEGNSKGKLDYNSDDNSDNSDDSEDESEDDSDDDSDDDAAQAMVDDAAQAMDDDDEDEDEKDSERESDSNTNKTTSSVNSHQAHDENDMFSDDEDVDDGTDYRDNVNYECNSEDIDDSDMDRFDLEINTPRYWTGGNKNRQVNSWHAPNLHKGNLNEANNTNILHLYETHSDYKTKTLLVSKFIEANDTPADVVYDRWGAGINYHSLSRDKVSIKEISDRISVDQMVDLQTRSGQLALYVMNHVCDMDRRSYNIAYVFELYTTYASQTLFLKHNYKLKQSNEFMIPTAYAKSFFKKYFTKQEIKTYSKYNGPLWILDIEANEENDFCLSADDDYTDDFHESTCRCDIVCSCSPHRSDNKLKRHTGGGVPVTKRARLASGDVDRTLSAHDDASEYDASEDQSEDESELQSELASELQSEDQSELASEDQSEDASARDSEMIHGNLHAEINGLISKLSKSMV